MHWQHWKHQVPTWTYPKKEERPKFAQLIIPTLDSVRFEKLLHLSYIVDKSSLLVGGPGTAKTSCINQFITKFNPETTSQKTITFSSLTTPQIFQITIEGAVEKRSGRTFGPPGGKQMVVFVDGGCWAMGLGRVVSACTALFVALLRPASMLPLLC